jgi:hypothetical protein
MKSLVAIACLTAAFLSPAHAQDNNGSCDRINDDVVMCPVPAKPAPPPTCHRFGDTLMCTAPIDDKRKPTNCGFNRKGVYVCW